MNDRYFVSSIQNCVGANTQSILTCFLRAHRCVWKFWFGGRLGSKFCMQSRFYVCKQLARCLCVGDVKKIDVKPIFIVPETLSNLTLFHETVKIGEASISPGIYCSRQDCKLNLNIKASRLWNIGTQTARKRFFTTEMVGANMSIATKLLHVQTKWWQFFLLNIYRVWLYSHLATYHTSLCAKFQVRTSFVSSFPFETILVHISRLTKWYEFCPVFKNCDRCYCWKFSKSHYTVIWVWYTHTWSQNLGNKQQQILSQQSKPFWWQINVPNWQHFMSVFGGLAKVQC